MYRVYYIPCIGYFFSFSFHINRITVRYELPNPTGHLHTNILKGVQKFYVKQKRYRKFAIDRPGSRQFFATHNF